MSRVAVFFDTVSPYSFIGVETLLRYRAVWGDMVKVELIPFFLGGVMKASGNQPPATNPVKGAYLMKDIERLGRQYSLPVGKAVPVVFPTNTLKAQRCLAALQLQKRDKDMERCALALWRAYWGGGNIDIGSDEGLSAVLASVLGVSDALSVVAASLESAAKRQLEDNTRRATEQGCFGAPWCEITNKQGEKSGLFGSDRMEMLCWMLDTPYLGPNPTATATTAKL